ncbi:MAG TPA: hypothetical protein VMT97_06615 [Terriglobales bacterium]|nr:hypothetical protein [Terriglobales bacterium]
MTVMNRSTRASIVVGCLIASVLLWAHPSPAASFADLPKDWPEVSLLKDRLWIRAPKAARLEPTPFGIMEAPPPAERQMLVVIDSGPLRLVAFVSEMFCVSPVDFTQLGTAYVKGLEQNPRLDRLSAAPNATNVNGLEVLEYEPRSTARIADANLVKGALIRHPDGSVQSIAFFVNDSGLADLPAARQLVTNMIASLKPGPRQLVTGARVQLAGASLDLDLPPDYTAYQQRGPDFDVYWIEHLVTLNQPAGRLGIYSGHHPQRPAHPAAARAQRAVLFGVDVQWRVWEEPSTQGGAVVFHQEAFVPVPAGGLIRHVFFTAVTPAERAAFERIAETAAFPPSSRP